MIDRQTISKVYDSANIVDVVSDYVSLKKRGANYIGLCPFHTEKTGSFTVSPSKSIFKCFGCGESGNAVSFIQKIENCNYPEAIRILAKKYHIEVVETELTEEEKRKDEEREQLFRLNDFALQWFENQLWNTEEGRAVGLSYFRQRGLRDDIIKKFRLGYSPNKNLLCKDAINAGFAPELLMEAGLCGKSESKDTYYDRFRERVIFPWFTLANKVVAFNGRILRNKENTGKYVNSPEREGFFEKRKELFGINFARKAIGEEIFCYMVEGQMDVISMVQAGVENVVASSGTSLTRQQVLLLKRFTENVTVLYDGDSAGINASKKGLNLFLEAGMNVRIVSLPDGEDPDSMSHKLNAADFISFLQNNQVDFVEYKAENIRRQTETDPTSISSLIGDICESIALVSDSIKREVYMRQTSKTLDFDYDAIRQKVEDYLYKHRIEKKRESERKERLEQTGDTSAPATIASNQENSTAPTSPAYKQQTAVLTRRQSIERDLLKLLIRDGQAPVAQYDDGSFCLMSKYMFDEGIRFSLPIHQQFVEEYEKRMEDKNFDAEHYFTTHPDPDITALAGDLLIERYQVSKLFDRQLENIPAVSPSDVAAKERQHREEMQRLFRNTYRLIVQLKISVIEEVFDMLTNRMKQISENDTDGLYRQMEAKQMELLKIKHQLQKELKQ